MPSAIGRYRIQAVAGLTGVPAATLRAWERRYGVPTPARTASAYRLYSDQDVDRVRRMRALIERGIAASRAAEEVLAERESSDPPQAAADGDAFAAVVARIVAAAMRFDERGLEEAVALAAASGSALAVFERVLGPAVNRVGDLWHRGQATVAQEHLISYVVLRKSMELLHLAAPMPGAPR
ncbi:MAG: MerR family transcriptional regulator [Polyangiaceae bacterium]